MSTFENLSNLQKTRATLYRDVKLICTETCHFLGLDITRPAMEIVTELVYKKIIVYGADLEAFAKHAKRNTINTEDVKLLVRRNPSLRAHLNSLAPNSATKDKRRKTVTLPVARQPETPSSSKTEENRTEAESPCQEKTENMVVDNMIDLTFD